MTDEVKKEKTGVSRRDFLKISGVAAVGVQVGAVAGAGLSAGKDPSTHTGWQHLGDNTQFVNRKPLEFDGLPYKIEGKISRPEEVESAFGRGRLMMQGMRRAREKKAPPAAGAPPGVPPESKEGMAADKPPERRPRGFGPMRMPPRDAFPKALADYYKKHPEIYDLDKLRMESIMPKKMQDMSKYGDYYTLINAWSSSWSTSVPIKDPPEISDFQSSGPGRGGRKLREPVPFKSPELASELIKKVAHHFGATMVGITKLNPNWCYNYGLRGSKDKGSYEVPKHWEYVIAFGIPHQWEQVLNPPSKDGAGLLRVTGCGYTGKSTLKDLHKS